MNSADDLVKRLLEAPVGVPVEECGATAALAAISGRDITAVMRTRATRELTAAEQEMLQAPGPAQGHERRGTLYAGHVPAASTTAVLLPHRLPAAVRETLGIDRPGGAEAAGHGVPLGRALAGLGVRREPMSAVLTPGLRDADGRELIITSAARLWLGWPIAIVAERVYRDFLAVSAGAQEPAAK